MAGDNLFGRKPAGLGDIIKIGAMFAAIRHGDVNRGGRRDVILRGKADHNSFNMYGRFLGRNSISGFQQ